MWLDIIILISYDFDTGTSGHRLHNASGYAL